MPKMYFLWCKIVPVYNDIFFAIDCSYCFLEDVVIWIFFVATSINSLNLVLALYLV